MPMFKTIAISFGIASVTTLAIYTFKVHRESVKIRKAVVDLAQNFIQYGMDLEFANIIEGLEDIDN